MFVRDALQEYTTSLKRLRPLTAKGYKQKLSVFCLWCEQNNIELEQIKAKVIDKFVEHLQTSRVPHQAEKSTISTYTLAGYVRVILAFLNWCLEDEEFSEYVKPIVVSRIKKPRIVQTIIEIFTTEQIEALFVACDREESEHLQARDRAILALLLDTGIRAAELCGLTIGYTDLASDDPHIRVLGKGSKEREVGLGDRARRELRRYIRRFRADVHKSAPVFINRYSQPLTVTGLDQLIRRLGTWAHIEGVRCSPHTFRHSFAVRFLLGGGDVYKLSRLLGHSTVKTTEEYLKAMKAIQARQGSKSVLDNL